MVLLKLPYLLTHSSYPDLSDLKLSVTILRHQSFSGAKFRLQLLLQRLSPQQHFLPLARSGRPRWRRHSRRPKAQRGKLHLGGQWRQAARP